MNITLNYDEARQLLLWLEAEQSIYRAKVEEIDRKIKLNQKMILQARNFLEAKNTEELPKGNEDKVSPSV